MDAVYLHGPEDLRVDAVDPRPVSAGAVAVDVEYTGICGSDLHEYEIGPVPIRAEDTDHSIPESAWDEHLPKPMGHEVAGTVSETGDDVVDVEVGDRVTLNMVSTCRDCRYCAVGKYHLCERGDGGAVSSRGFADRIVVPESMVVPVPEDVSLRHAALAEPLGVSLRGVRRSGLETGDRVAVFGAGPIGLGVVAGAVAAGAREVYVSEPRAARREAAEALGADVVFDPADVDVVERLRNEVDRVEVSFECAGTETTLTDALRSTAYGETVVVLSVFDEEVALHPNDIMQAERELVGSFGFRGGPLASRSEFQTALEFVADGRIEPEPMITDTVPLADVESAFEDLRDPESEQIKVLVEP
ncbi:zinc-binding dehydrogenase [Natronolimnohabitans innermongolicus]|uniref:Alcohol dehydrogenase zinc-binding domain protein n=1 Tax=Natronolimnohabitans innermongolicus JCM 12255 TaxID=1227499 RepID=L9WKZ3_9EURY|nr:zinc-binding dehydrogenase [Natronolimnohabitans innermongolicus]ELY50170.1 alcohol dehydrogenase zinc-binding domain protein [Natronolimnohabitans innermongolicus JCM 12255]